MMIPSNPYPATLEISCVPESGGQTAQNIARSLQAQLGEFGYSVMGIDDLRSEDVIWVELANIDPFAVQLAIFPKSDAQGRVFVSAYPPLPFVRVWLRKVPTGPVVERLLDCVTSILERSPECGTVRRMSEDEARQWVKATHRRE